ncbi:hypothetical protein TRL7639_00362 [Falsiruegeria litorea R37]|uniref:Uncharacterized protein n=1 Tax=Falsiruegeria litorea R37 TaxID=1200284 RepID=A0A1Y5RJW9_9RHOB|nr:hypothetical protein [Falsiruegeria litorea]SLN18094.1 hypothetical protein TRL7639_00362 [Falsiruegeria litorea R37]
MKLNFFKQRRKEQIQDSFVFGSVFFVSVWFLRSVVANLQNKFEFLCGDRVDCPSWSSEFQVLTACILVVSLVAAIVARFIAKDVLFGR